MTKTMLMGVSALALLVSLPAFAADTTVKSETSLETKTENAMDKAGKTIEKAADKTEAAVKNAYSDVKAYFTDEDDIKATSTVTIPERNTAKALIGTKVQNSAGKDVGKIDDIIVTADGDAEMVIIQDGGVLGLGSKLAAFDFDVIEGYNTSDDVVVKLSDQSVKAATPFEYEASANADKKITTQPANTFRVSKITGADVLDSNGKKVATVDTVTFDGDDAELAVVTFDKILGLGGEKAALDIDALDLVNDNGKYKFKLNAQQTAQFENYKATTRAN